MQVTQNVYVWILLSKRSIELPTSCHGVLVLHLLISVTCESLEHAANYNEQGS